MAGGEGRGRHRAGRGGPAGIAHAVVKALKGTADQLGTPVRLPWIGFEGLMPKAFIAYEGKVLISKKPPIPWLKRAANR